MTTHLGLQRILLPSAQVSSLTTGSITLPSARGSFSTAGNGGYFAGGRDGSSTLLSSIAKVSFINDSTSTLSATIVTAKHDVIGYANSGTAGYVAGGRNSAGTDQSSIDKLSFSNETISNLGATLGTAVSDGAGHANSGTAGYACGGYSSPASAFQNKYQKLLFSNDTASTIGATMSKTANAFTGFANSGTAGYVGTRNNNTFDKLTYSSETNSTISSGYSWINEAGAANSGTAGYALGGDADGSAPFSEGTTIHKVTFSSDTTSTLGATLSVPRYDGGAFAKSGTAAYIGGGNSTSGVVASVNKLAFSNETITTLSASLSVARENLAGSGFADSGAL